MGNSNTDTDTDIFYRNCNYSTATAGNNSHKFTQLESRVSQLKLKLKQFKDVQVALPDTRQNEIPDRDGSRVIYYPRVSGRVHTTRSALVSLISNITIAPNDARKVAFDNFIHWRIQ